MHHLPAISAASAGILAFILQTPPSLSNSSQPEVLLDHTLTALSVAGAIGGGFMAIAFFPSKAGKGAPPSVRQDMTRWLGCTLFGGTFAPFVIDHILPRWGFGVSASSALAVSSFLGMFAWALVAIIPTIISAIPTIIQTYFAAKK